MYGDFKLFGDKDVTLYFDEINKSIEKEIEKISEDTILKGDFKIITETLNDKFKIQNLVFDFENIKKDVKEEEIEARDFPRSRQFDRNIEGKYKVFVVSYNIPFKGNSELLKLIPTKRTLWTLTCLLFKDSLYFKIISYSRNPEEVKNEYNSNLENIKKQNDYLKTNIDYFNNNLKNYIDKTLNARKKRIEEKNKFFESI